MRGGLTPARAPPALSSTCCASWGATKFAEIDPEEFYDFTQERPRSYRTKDGRRGVRWPANEFYYWRAPRPVPEGSAKGALFFIGVEPNLKWRTFSEIIANLALDYGVKTVVHLGALLDAVPHTREIKLTGSSSNPELHEALQAFKVTTSNYQGPTGISTAVMSTITRKGMNYASLWGHTSHYLQAAPQLPGLLYPGRAHRPHLPAARQPGGTEVGSGRILTKRWSRPSPRTSSWRTTSASWKSDTTSPTRKRPCPNRRTCCRNWSSSSGRNSGATWVGPTRTGPTVGYRRENPKTSTSGEAAPKAAATTNPKRPRPGAGAPIAMPVEEAIRLMTDEYGPFPDETQVGPHPRTNLYHPFPAHLGHQLGAGLPQPDGAVWVIGGGGRGQCLKDIEQAISGGGLAKVKAPRIKEVLSKIIELNGSLDLSFLREMPLPEAKAWLRQLPGIGPKSAGIILSFSLGMPAMAIDTHIYRVSQRMALIGPKVTADKAHDLLEDAVAPDQVYPFHQAFINHGRLVCKAQRPRCPECVVGHGCPSPRRLPQGS